MSHISICQGSGISGFENQTRLHTGRLRQMCLHAVSGWRLDGLKVNVRYSRGADFSGTCIYAHPQIYVNLGRHLQYPYVMETYIARARSDAHAWWKPSLSIELADAYQLVLFVFLHECYHLLVKRAKRNTRQKESMCDRFAVRHLVDRYGATLRDSSGKHPQRNDWDFQDLDTFVVAAKRRPAQTLQSARHPSTPANSSTSPPPIHRDGQILLFDF